MIYSHLCNTKCNTKAKNIDKSTVLQGFDSPRLHHLKKPCNARLLCFISLYFKAFAPFLIPNPEYIFQEKILFSEKMQHEMQHEYNIKNTLNIMRKSNVVSLDAVYARGEVDTPVRIRIA